jgi:O-antigen/teichoic acid export membrane protein
MTAIGAVSQGLSKIIRAQMPSLFVSPLVFLILLTLTTDFYQDAISVAEVIALTIVAQAFALGVLILSTRSILPSGISRVPARFHIKEWLNAAMPLTLMGGMYVINMNADIVMLGTLASADAAGIYKAATRGADLVIFSLMIINPVLSPIVAQLHTAGQRVRLQRGITRMARIGLLLSLPVALFLVFFGDWFLSLFGPDYTEGKVALAILSVGQVVNVAAGSVAMIMIMTGNERIAALGVAVSTLVNISMNAILIPVWGIEGAAIATTTSIVLWNVLLVRYAWKLLGVDTTSFGFLVRRVSA